jgi:outer membrane protein TolC
VGALVAAVLLHLTGPGGYCQVAQPRPGAAGQEYLPPPRSVQLKAEIEPLAPEEEHCAPGMPINFEAALRLALTANLDIAQARELVNQARARLARGEVQMIPNFNIGMTYNHHEGNIQKTEGNIIKANRDSMFVGGGPQLSFQTTEAIFGPLALRRLTQSAVAGRRRVENDTELAVAEAYLNMLRARRRLARINETLSHLLDEQPSSLRANSKGMLPLIREFVERGAREAFPADLERVRVEILRRQDELEGAVNEFRVAAAELARLLRLDPAVPLYPVEDFRYPLPIPGETWAARPLEELVVAALSNRPEVVENRALVDAAVARVRAAKLRPLLPNGVLNYAWGDFGGGPDILKSGGFGPSGELRHMSTRTEFDAGLVWRFDNMGLGNRAEMREQESIHRSFTLRQLQIQDRVVTQVVQAYDQVRSWRERLTLAYSALFNDAGEPTGPAFRSLRLNFDRIRLGEGRPLEVLDSIRGLSDTLEAYGQALTDYERAQVRLLVALGLSAERWLDPADLVGHARPIGSGCTPNP